MNAGATSVVICQVRFMKHLLFFLNTVEFWPLVQLPVLGCGWGPALLQEEQGEYMPHGNEFPEQLFCSSLLPSPNLGQIAAV